MHSDNYLWTETKLDNISLKRLKTQVLGDVTRINQGDIMFDDCEFCFHEFAVSNDLLCDGAISFTKIQKWVKKRVNQAYDESELFVPVLYDPEAFIKTREMSLKKLRNELGDFQQCQAEKTDIAKISSHPALDVNIVITIFRDECSQILPRKDFVNKIIFHLTNLPEQIMTICRAYQCNAKVVDTFIQSFCMPLEFLDYDQVCIKTYVTNGINNLCKCIQSTLNASDELYDLFKFGNKKVFIYKNHSDDIEYIREVYFQSHKLLGNYISSKFFPPDNNTSKYAIFEKSCIKTVEQAKMCAASKLIELSGQATEFLIELEELKMKGHSNIVEEVQKLKNAKQFLKFI